MNLSVIIPAYNEEKYLEKTLQALNDVEVIVVCNGCTDKTEEIARKYATQVVVLSEKGVSRARNAGAQVASHSKLVFLDADILVDNKVLENITISLYSVGTCSVKADSSYVLDKILMWGKSQFHKFGTSTGLLFMDKDLFEQSGKFEEDLNKREDGRLLRRAKHKAQFGIVKGYVYNNMRRYRQKGYFRIWAYWIKEYLIPSEKEYESIR